MIYLYLAEGFEEIEALAPVDLLRRAGKKIVTVGVGSKNITGAHGITVTADIEICDAELSHNVEMIILPGGMPGTLNFEAVSAVQNAIDYCAKNNIYIAAICAAPSILGHKGLLNGKTAVCYPGFEKDLVGADIGDNSVVADGNIITAKGAGVAVKFALKLIELLVSHEESEHIGRAIICDCYAG